jgi:hypothetical protein
MFQMGEQFYILIHIFQRFTATQQTVSWIAVITGLVPKDHTWHNFMEAGFPGGF